MSSTSVFYPRELSAKLLYSGGSDLVLYVELWSQEPELWFEMKNDVEVTGYVRLVKLATLRAGLATYRAEEFRSPDNPPPNLASYQSVFRELCPGDYELLVSGKSVLPRG